MVLAYLAKAYFQSLVIREDKKGGLTEIRPQ